MNCSVTYTSMIENCSVNKFSSNAELHLRNRPNAMHLYIFIQNEVSDSE